MKSQEDYLNGRIYFKSLEAQVPCGVLRVKNRMTEKYESPQKFKYASAKQPKRQTKS